MPWPLLPHPFHYLIRFLDVSLRRTQIHVRACSRAQVTRRAFELDFSRCDAEWLRDLGAL